MSALNAKHFEEDETPPDSIWKGSGGQMRRLPALWFDLQGSLRPSGQGSSPGPLEMQRLPSAVLRDRRNGL